MLLPAKFQTPTPAPLGAKVVAIAPAPKPHVHQWVSVPDSKIHSRCAECGTVTLTEIVAPKVMAYAPTAGGQAMLDLVADINGQIAQAMGMIPQWVGVDPAAPGSDRTAFSEHFLGKPYSFVDLLRAPEQANKTGAEFRMKLQALDAELRAGEAALKVREPKFREADAKLRTPAPEISDSDLWRETVAFLDGSDDRRLAGAHARSVLAEMGFKKTINIPQHRRAEFLKALTTWPQEPAKHYTSIITLDGRVRMVETDAEGWIKNDGTQPVASGVKVECRLRAAQSKGVAPADEWRWRDTGTEWSITHWRPAA